MSNEEASPELSASKGPRNAWLYRKPAWISAVVIIVLIAAGGVFYLGGGYGQWADRRSLSNACHGVLPYSELRSTMTVDRIQATDGLHVYSDDGQGRLAACAVDGPDGNPRMYVNVHWGSEATKAPAYLHHENVAAQAAQAVPVGQGWQGSVVFGDPAQAAVLLGCSNKATQSLMVSVEMGNTSGTPFDSPGKRAQFAQTTTDIAARAAKTFGCTAKLGDTVSNIAAAPQNSPRSVAQAQGTCEAAVSHATQAQRLGMTAVFEAPNDPNTPVEDCFLNDSSGSTLYRLTALYGPFAHYLGDSAGYSTMGRPSGSWNTGGWAWGSAQCPGDLSQASYTLAAAQKATGGFLVNKPDPSFEDSLLHDFATASAKRHGCTKPDLP
ncbi:hypothetical protein [Streptantibioticus ferralitis]|uniref:DUF1906 domain-containing protein n=1 Tax=Streptantibioticus ferralitis TaxID=236510 RepID=A0ABT5ZA84_9ACTN|nr:hypothetical protein [Streptantibioticus ferralitis]MDF2260753.1 hypothetical protein [Streptantibioticus ferralitis]